MRNGISGIFMKHNSAALLVEGIRHVLAGKVWFDREFLQAAMGASSAQESKGEHFTERERQVLSYVFEGLINKESSERIGVSQSSVKRKLQQHFLKTGARSRRRLVRSAMRQ